MLTRDQLKDGRALLHWTAKELGERSGIRYETILRLESGKLDIGRSSMATVRSLRDALEAGGIVFMEDGAVRKRAPSPPGRE